MAALLKAGKKAKLTFHQLTNMKETRADMLVRFVMKRRKQDLQHGYVLSDHTIFLYASAYVL